MHRMTQYVFWGSLVSIPFFIIFGYKFLPFVLPLSVLLGEMFLNGELKKMIGFSKYLLDKHPNLLDNSIFGNQNQITYLISTSEKEMFLFAPGYFIPQLIHLLPEFQLDYTAASGYFQILLFANLFLSMIFFNFIAILITICLLVYILFFSKTSYSFLTTVGTEKRLIRLFFDNKKDLQSKPYHFTDEKFIKYYYLLFLTVSKKIYNLKIREKAF